jgi:hypothetical protein
MRESLMVIVFVIAYIALIRFVLPRLGVPT